MSAEYTVLRDQPVAREEIESLRESVGWDRMEGKYDRILPRLHTHYTVRVNGDLVGFLSVLSDGIGDAFLIDLMVHPNQRRRGIASQLVQQAIADLRAEGIKCIQVIFDPEMESFFKRFGFHILRAGIIDTETMEVDL
jgi:ribosomal protein S18 acetylase RimI-like enzyme